MEAIVEMTQLDMQLLFQFVYGYQSLAWLDLARCIEIENTLQEGKSVWRDR